ncbi:MAG: zinc ribbon domain-containing protein [Bacteroidota bacterium]
MADSQIECPSCALDIDANTDICPFCGYDLPQQKRSYMPVVILFVLLMLSFALYELLVAFL